MKQKVSFSFLWKIGQIWWLIFLPIFFLHWLSPLLAGALAKKRSWVYWAVYNFLTVVLLFVATPMPDSLFKNLSIGIFIFSWLGCFIHSIIIADKFIRTMIDIKLGRTLKKNEKLNREQQNYLKGYTVMHKQWIQMMLIEKKEILDNYNKIDPILQNEMLDLLEIVESYIDYARELMLKEEEIEKILKKLNINNIEQRIRQLNQQISKTTNINLKNEYQNAIENYQKHKDTYLDFNEKKKMINLKIESNIGKLREVKYDLIELKYKNSETEKNDIFQKANMLSEDITVFIDTLKETHNELHL